eukprot:9608710-Karenia_brevis.AAC.1
MSPNALPDSTNINAESDIVRSLKHFQIGPMAVQGLISATVNGVAALDSQAGVFVIDLAGNVGDGVLGFLQWRRQLEMPTFYIGFFEDANEAAFA